MISSAEPREADCGRTPDDDAPPLPRSGLFGRRRGKRLTARCDELLLTALPAIELDPTQPIKPEALSESPPSAVWLEIGFGGGEHLAAVAQAEPQALFLGCEAFHNGVAKALVLIEEQGLRNIRLYEGDARAVVEALPEAALDGVYLLYPDPWPKRRQRKRRFISDLMLTRLARAMREGGELRFATDIDDKAGWTLARIQRSPHFSWMPKSAADWREPWAGWGGTRYESKALREGRRPAYFTFVRNAAPIS